MPPTTCYLPLAAHRLLYARHHRPLTSSLPDPQVPISGAPSRTHPSDGSSPCASRLGIPQGSTREVSLLESRYADCYHASVHTHTHRERERERERERGREREREKERERERDACIRIHACNHACMCSCMCIPLRISSPPQPLSGWYESLQLPLQSDPRVCRLLPPAYVLMYHCERRVPLDRSYLRISLEQR